jgi:hypothetical protein
MHFRSLLNPSFTEFKGEVQMRSRVISGLLAAGVTVAMGVGLAGPAQAASDSGYYYYSAGRYLQANVWLGAGQSFGYQTSSQYKGTGAGPSVAASITNTAGIQVNGVGVSLGNSVGGVNGSTNNDKDFSTTWTNYNTWISDRAGTNKVSNNFYLNIVGYSDAKATIPYFGSPRTAATNVTKWA